jgi:hypothetical protein
MSAEMLPLDFLLGEIFAHSVMGIGKTTPLFFLDDDRVFGTYGALAFADLRQPEIGVRIV